MCFYCWEVHLRFKPLVAAHLAFLPAFSVAIGVLDEHMKQKIFQHFQRLRACERPPFYQDFTPPKQRHAWLHFSCFCLLTLGVSGQSWLRRCSPLSRLMQIFLNVAQVLSHYCFNFYPSACGGQQCDQERRVTELDGSGICHFLGGAAT